MPSGEASKLTQISHRGPGKCMQMPLPGYETEGTVQRLPIWRGCVGHTP